MESGILYRKLVNYAGQAGFVCGFTAIFLALAHYTFPSLKIISSFPMVVAFTLLSVVGAGGFSIGLIQGIKILRKRRSKTKEISSRVESAQFPEQTQISTLAPYLLADSIDREVLSAVREIGGHVLDVEERLAKRGLIPAGDEYHRRISKLVLLGLLSIIENKGQMYLTTAGMDALNTPAALFVSRIPETVWNHVFQQKTSLWREDWGNVVIETAKALEAAMHHKLDIVKQGMSDKWDEARKGFPSKPLEKWSAGSLLGMLRKLDLVKPNSLEDHLAGELVKIRNKVHHDDEDYVFGPSDADKCDVYLALLLRSWFGSR